MGAGEPRRPQLRERHGQAATTAGQGGGQRRWCRVTPACASSAGVPRQRPRCHRGSAVRVAVAVGATLPLRVRAGVEAERLLFIDPAV